MQGIPQSPVSPKYTKLNHTEPSVSNTDWQMCQESSRSRVQANKTQEQVHGSSRGTMKALLLWVLLLSIVNTSHGSYLELLQVQAPNPVLLSAEECHGYLSTQREVTTK